MAEIGSWLDQFRTARRENSSYLDVQSKQSLKALRELYAFEAAVDTEPTNESATIVARSKVLTGTVEIPSYSKAFELYGFQLGGRRKTIVGDTGDLQATGHVIMEDIKLIMPDTPAIEKALQSTFKGQDVGTLFIAYLRNTGKTDQVAFELELTNPRVNAIIVRQETTIISVGFNTMQMSYDRMSTGARAEGRSRGGYDLTKNKSL